MMWNDTSWGAGGWLAMSLMVLVFWGGLAAFVVWLLVGRRASTAARSEPGALVGADAVLAERFARGDIDEDEFNHRRSVLHAAGRS